MLGEEWKAYVKLKIALVDFGFQLLPHFTKQAQSTDCLAA